jgi:phosphatidylinositol alpha-1,6-mannosyltransferase
MVFVCRRERHNDCRIPERGVRHLLVTQDYLPDLGGTARRHLELVRRYPEPMSVSTVAAPAVIDGMSRPPADIARCDAAEEYLIERQPFSFAHAKWFLNQIRWGRWLVQRCRDRVDVMHCGNIRPVGDAVWWAHKRLRIPYVVYVSGDDLLREQNGIRASRLRRRIARLILGDAAGIVTTSAWCAELTRNVLGELGIDHPPPVAAIDLGTDPRLFHPARDTGTLRQRWGIRRAPIMLTVARLVPHKGQDTGIRVLAQLRHEFPTLRYVLVGDGVDEPRLRNLAAELDVMGLVGFAGSMRDDELPEAYATATVYFGASRRDGVDVEGLGLSFVEAAASGLPVVAGDAGGVHSTVRHGETGFVVDPLDVDALADAVALLLRDEERRNAMSIAGRAAVETHYNWQRVADETARFVEECVARG